MSINALEDIRKSIQTEVLNTTLELVCQTSDKHIIEKVSLIYFILAFDIN